MTKKATLDTQLALDLYRRMLLIRRFEEKAGEKYMQGKISGFLHLYIGEEAVATGVFSALGPQDYIVTHYREHGHALARGIEPKRVMAELFGKATGTSQGRGGSMHIFDASRGFMGGYAIVGGMLPVATGLALASRLRKDARVTLCIFGDGALNEGEFWESMNLASLWRLPVIFLLENNGYGMGTATRRACALRDIHKAPDLYGIPTSVVDGMDVLAVREVALQAVEHVRSRREPYFIEAACYRFRGHSVTDPAVYRERSEEDQWKQRDPITGLQRRLEAGGVTQQDFERIVEEVEQVINEAVRFADESPELPTQAIHDNVYAQ